MSQFLTARWCAVRRFTLFVELILHDDVYNGFIACGTL